MCYLEKDDRALVIYYLNLPAPEIDPESELSSYGPYDWVREMDATRATAGNDTPWHGKPARTYKHYVLSRDPGDRIKLSDLRRHTMAWVRENFADFEVAVVYHDDNSRGIPLAHIVVNNANLRTGYRMQTRHPEDLNRDLQDMARERGLSSLSNDREPESLSRARKRAGAGGS